MEKAGFLDIQEFNYKMLLGAWAKDPRMKQLGEIGQAVLESNVEGYILFMANTLGWSREEIHVYISHLRCEIRSGKLYPYYR
ncbi:hypothetical protein jhhlp_000173 [Lomentospora prolificans]|uniref:Uncharacterized protein n=1 Tax=Lomentospora prolificans TaxID=41688 RepID=A0A2N3NM22_9PEZI|nr:hypothetical protein jhhlp_000173 [Lomentospora prolificans]